MRVSPRRVSDEVIIELLFLRKSSYTCACGGEFKRLARRHKGYQCTKCYGQIHPQSGTIFHKTYLPYWIWIYAYEAFLIPGYTAFEFGRITGVHSNTALRMRNKVKRDPEIFEYLLEMLPKRTMS